MAEIFAAELRPNAKSAGQLKHFSLKSAIAIGLPVPIAFGRKAVEIAATGELDGLQGQFGRGAADNDCQMVGWAGGGAERADVLVEKFDQGFWVQHRLRLLKQKALIG